MCEFPPEKYEALWLQAKAVWKIKNDAPKNFMKKFAVKRGTNFRGDLKRDYVDTKKTPFAKHKFINDTDWALFVQQKNSETFKEKSARAKTANAASKTKVRVGRSGWTGFKENKPHVWPELIAKYPDISRLRNPRSKLLLAGQARLNKETQSYELNDAGIELGVKLYQAEEDMIKGDS